MAIFDSTGLYRSLDAASLLYLTSEVQRLFSEV